MINKKKTIFNCCVCQSQTTTLHEVIFGHGKRDISVKYNIQVPLCPVCHAVAHGRFLLNGHTVLLSFTKKGSGRELIIDQRAIQDFFLEILDLDRHSVIMAVNDKSRRNYLQTVADSCLQIIMSYAV